MSSDTSPSKSGRAKVQPSGPSQLDSTLCGELQKLVENMTHSGRPSLEEQPLTKLKKICRTSDAYVEHAFNLLSSQLTEEHAEIRLSAFQIMREIFTRSHHFRELLVADMQEFLELVVGTNGDLPLPPPRGAAKLLKEQALNAIQEWNAKYGKAYKKLALGYGFLKYNKMVDFANLEARSAAEQTAREARQAKLQLALAQKVSRTLNDMEETIPEINECLTQIENCFELLLPHPTRYHETTFPSDAIESTSKTAVSDAVPFRRVSEEKTTGRTGNNEKTACTDGKTCTTSNQTAEQSISTHKPDVTKSQVKGHDQEETEGRSPSDDLRLAGPGHAGKEDGLLQQHGLPSWNYSIEINVNTDGVTLEEDEDNQAILSTLEDMDRLIKTSYLPHIANWMEVLSKSGKHDDKLKRCMDIKQALQDAVAKYTELNIHPKESDRRHSWSSIGTAEEARDSESEVEFEDVPEKEGYEPCVPDHLWEEYGLCPSPSTSQDTKRVSIATEESTQNATSSNTPSSSSNSTTTLSASSTTSSKTLESWHPLREAQHHLADPASQAGTIQAMKERLRAIRDRELTQKRKSSTTNEDVSSEKRHRQQLLAKAPVVLFGVDLEHWSSPEKIEAPTVVLADTAQRVWSSSAPDEVKVMEAARDSMTTRVFNYTGKFEPVKWTCRAPLPSGKLCQRMDRYKCPFHGRIIPRDKQGNPEKAEDKARFQLTKEQQIKAKSLLDAAELQQDIEDGLGLDLGGSSSICGKGKKGKGKTKKYPNLTDLKKTSNTAMARLEKRVLNKKALQRVANAMNKLEQRRYKDKFSNNFNYR